MKKGITKEELIDYFSKTNAVKFEVFNKKEINMNIQPVFCDCRCDCSNYAIEDCAFCHECGGSKKEQNEREQKELNKIALMKATGAL